MDELEVEAVQRVMRARSPFRYYGANLQREVVQFESELAEFVGRRHCVGVSSGTAALEVAVAALGVGPGDEVIVPGYFWVSTVGAVVKNGAIPVLADIDDSFSLDPEDLLTKITARTKAVIMVHMGGVIGQIERVASICKERRIGLLEDCAQSIGASKFGKQSGSFGDVAIYSFQLNKTCTAGEGGAIVTDDASLFARSVAVHDLGYARDAEGRLVVDDASHQYWGLGCRMSEITAAILRVQLRKLPLLLAEMREVKAQLKAVTSRYQRIRTRPMADPGGDTGGFLKLRFENQEIAQRFQRCLTEIGSREQVLALYSFLMSDWGLHIYYQNASLTNKRSICGHHSVWEWEENRFAREHEYGKGTLPRLDAMASESLIYPIPVGLDIAERKILGKVFDETCRVVVPNTP
jgi:8-amino-3,8-dideoxy-alpha-D-manno-octulosonate transaminase